MEFEYQSEKEQLPVIVDINPAKLRSRQTPAEMSKNRVNKLRKKNGFDRTQPIEVVEVDRKTHNKRWTSSSRSCY